MKPLHFVVVFCLIFTNGRNNFNLNFKCVCCGYFSFEKKRGTKFTLFCFSKDDGEADLDVIINPKSDDIKKRTKNFLKFGVCEKRCKKSRE